jgi:hypothetical protein
MDIIEDSPFQELIKFLREFILKDPTTLLNTAESNQICKSLFTHSLQLIEACGTLNAIGFHTSALSLFRQIDDSIDTFVCCGVVPESPAKWKQDKLRASDAAKKWIPVLEDKLGRSEEFDSFSNYRKNLRSKFNKYSHCSVFLLNWNIKNVNSDYLLNISPSQIEENAVVIDANLAFAQYEALYLSRFVYKDFLDSHEELRNRIDKFLDQTYPIIADMEEKEYYNNLNFPPELKDIKHELEVIDS